MTSVEELINFGLKLLDVQDGCYPQEDAVLESGNGRPVHYNPGASTPYHRIK